MELIGHRGCANQYPENTVRAIKQASQYLDAVEVDVRRCGSGELVAVHDERVDRVTNSSGAVADMTHSQLQQLDVLGSGEGVPLLEDIVAAVPGSITLQVELKEPGIAADALDVVEDAGADVTFTSFRPSTLAELRLQDEWYPSGLLFAESPDENLLVADELDCTQVNPHYDLCLETDIVERARKRRFDVVAWKAVQTTDEIEALRATGVDGVTVDRWDIGYTRDSTATVPQNSSG